MFFRKGFLNRQKPKTQYEYEGADHHGVSRDFPGFQLGDAQKGCSTVENARPLIAHTPLPRATKANGELLGRDFNPLNKRLLLHTDVREYITLSG